MRRVAGTYGPVTIDYINPHGAGTRVGDPVEVSVIRRIFGDPSPLVSSTKPLNGQSQGAAGARTSSCACLEAPRHRFYSSGEWLGGTSLSSFANSPG